MAYKRQQQRILAGSVNLHSAGDLLPEEDAQEIKNFAYDSMGHLRSRRGHTLVSAIGSPVHTQIKALGARYQGAGSALYKAGSSVATGFDGNPLGVAAYKRWLWVMNQSKQGKYDGTNFRNWSIAAPVDAPTAAAGAEVATYVAHFESASETWTVDPTGSDSFDSVIFVEGTQSLYLNAADEGTWTLQAAITSNLALVGGNPQTVQDKFRIYIYSNKAHRIDEVTIRIDCGDGSFNKDYYTATIPHRYFRKAKKEWTPYYIRRTDSKDDKLPFFERVGATAGKDWSTVAGVRIAVNTRNAVKIKFDKFQVYGGTDAEIEGDEIQYYATWANADGHESNPSPASTFTVVDLQNVGITQPATASTDPQVTHWNVYRAGGGLDGVYRVNQTQIPIATTTFNDIYSNEDLTSFGIQMDTDNDAPPAAKVLAGPYLGYLLVGNSSANKARLWWSAKNKPYKFPGAALDTGQWVDIGDTGEEIVAMTVRPRLVLIYKENSVHRLVGDPDDTSGDTEITNCPIGLIGANGVCKAGSFDFMQAKDGIFRFNGETIDKVSDKLDPIFHGQTTTLASGVTIPAISASNRDKSCIAFKNDRIYFSYPESGQTEPNITIVLDLSTGHWTRDSRGFRSIYNEGENGELLGGQSAGDVVAMENGTDDAGSTIPVDFISRLYNAGAPDTDKTWEDVTIEANTGGVALTATAYLDNGATTVALGTVTSSSRQRFILQLNAALGQKSRNIEIRINGSVSVQVALYAVVLNYYTEARQGKSFDTDEVDSGTHRMKLLREAVIDCDNPGSITLKVYSDHPAEAMALRETKTISTSSTRRMAHVMFDEDIQGFLHRLVMSATDLRIYALRLLIKIIGTFLLGTKGEFYSTDVLDFDTERIKLYREIEVVYKSANEAELTVYTDLPAGTLQLRETYTLSSTTGEEAAKVRLPGECWGRLFQLYIRPDGDFQLETIRVRLKSIGEPNATAWAWVNLPVEHSQDATWVDVPLPIDEAA